MIIARTSAPDALRPTAGRLVAAAFFSIMILSMPALLVAQEAQDLDRHEQPGEHHEATEGHGGELHHRNHLALFIGATEAEEHHGEKDDPDFTLGIDYSRRLSPLFGVGGLFEVVVEGKREFVLGAIGLLHPYGGLKIYAGPCYQKIREGSQDKVIFRVGVTWDIEVGKYSIGPSVIYDLSDDQNFLVLGVAIGRGF